MKIALVVEIRRFFKLTESPSTRLLRNGHVPRVRRARLGILAFATPERFGLAIGRQFAVVFAAVVHQSAGQGFHIAHALRELSIALEGAGGRDGHDGEQGDDYEHHEQFDQRESTVRFHSGLWLGEVGAD
jgi:hypothetical protein